MIVTPNIQYGDSNRFTAVSQIATLQSYGLYRVKHYVSLFCLNFHSRSHYTGVLE